MKVHMVSGDHEVKLHRITLLCKLRTINGYGPGVMEYSNQEETIYILFEGYNINWNTQMIHLSYVPEFLRIRYCVNAIIALQCSAFSQFRPLVCII